MKIFSNLSARFRNKNVPEWVSNKEFYFDFLNKLKDYLNKLPDTKFIIDEVKGTIDFSLLEKETFTDTHLFDLRVIFIPLSEENDNKNNISIYIGNYINSIREVLKNNKNLYKELSNLNKFQDQLFIQLLPSNPNLKLDDFFSMKSLKIFHTIKPYLYINSATSLYRFNEEMLEIATRTTTIKKLYDIAEDNCLKALMKTNYEVIKKDGFSNIFYYETNDAYIATMAYLLERYEDKFPFLVGNYGYVYIIPTAYTFICFPINTKSDILQLQYYQKNVLNMHSNSPQKLLFPVAVWAYKGKYYIGIIITDKNNQIILAFPEESPFQDLLKQS